MHEVIWLVRDGQALIELYALRTDAERREASAGPSMACMTSVTRRAGQ